MYVIESCTLHHTFRQIWLPAKCPVTLVSPVGTSKDPVPSHHSVEETCAKKDIRMLILGMRLVTMETIVIQVSEPLDSVQGYE